MRDHFHDGEHQEKSNAKSDGYDQKVAVNDSVYLISENRQIRLCNGNENTHQKTDGY